VNRCGVETVGDTDGAGAERSGRDLEEAAGRGLAAVRRGSVQKVLDGTTRQRNSVRCGDDR